MRAPDSLRDESKLPAGVAVTPLFLVLGLCLGAFLAYYWFAVLAPQLDANARANATALANSQAQILADAISGDDEEAAQRRLAGIMDEILIAREPTSGEPMFMALRTEIDYDAVHLPVGSVDIAKDSGACQDCLDIDVPLYARTSRELLGIAYFRANLLFVRELKQDVRDKLTVGAALLLVVIGGIWWAVANLLRKIARSEHNLRTVFEAAPVPMLLVRRRDGCIVRGNRAVAELFGVAAAELAGLRPGEFQRGRQGQRPLCGPQAETQRVEGRELEIEDRDGRRRWVLASSHPIGFFDEPAHIISYAEISALKQIQKELTAARDAAEQATQAKSMFVANMSHEIRTPLNAVLGFCHLAERTRLDEKQRKYLGNIRKATDSLLGIINNILDFSRLDAERLTLDLLDFSLAGAVDDVIEMFGVMAAQRGLELCSEVAPAVPEWVHGDPQRLKQVLINLLGNGLKFTERGAVKLRVTLDGAEPQAVVLRFEVEDSGIGIDAAVIPRLFQSFTQADNSTTRRYGGTGLGLAICRSLVELMGGEIGVRSRPGSGSTFWFTARFGMATAPETAAGEGPQSTALPRRGARILVVEDNRINQRIMQELLAGYGLQVGLAGDGIEAVEMLQREAFDLVLMDLQMPRMDGFQATAKIRERHDRLSLPIVAMTAHGRDEDREKCLSAGMNDHLTKPVDPAMLALTLSRWLGADDQPVDVSAAGAGSVGDDDDGLWLELPGVDLAAGLARAGGKSALYLRLLRDFRQDHADSMKRIVGELAAGRPEAAARLVHNLKGTAGNLGARALERRLAGLERALAGHGQVEERLGEAAAELTQLVGAIDGLSGGETVPVEPGQPDAVLCAELFEDLRVALRSGSFKAVHLLEPLAQALAGQCGEPFEELSKRVHAFDFDRAEDALASLARELAEVVGEFNDGR